MDGVPMLTQDLINPADTTTYSFILPDEGTDWYHSHYISHEQVVRGMMGAFGSFKNGETVRITLANDTSFPHGIHLHDYHFYEVDESGALGDLRDTTLVNARESRDIICVFDNPGRWVLHCHMLSHAVGGMRTWVNVA